MTPPLVTPRLPRRKDPSERVRLLEEVDTPTVDNTVVGCSDLGGLSDVEAALARSRDGGGSPLDLAGQPVSPELRQSFRERVAELRAGLRADYELNGFYEINSLEERLVQRQAVNRALVEHGILSTRRGTKSLLDGF